MVRIFNPVAGIGADERYIYVGYDGCAVLRTSTNPIGPMMSKHI